MKYEKTLLLIICLLLFCTVRNVSADAPETAGEKYLLRYQFQKGDVLKWDVVQQINMKTQVATQQNETNTHSRSTKVWMVVDVAEDGTAVLEYSVEDAEIENKTVTKNSAPANDEPATKEEEAEYNSKNEKKEKNPYFDEVRKSIGIPLAHLTINVQGAMIKKVQKAPYAAATEENRIAIPMPEKPIAVGETWDAPNDIVVPQHNGTVKKIVAKQRFTLEKVQNGIATIKYKTMVLTPIDSAKLRMQIIDKAPQGTVSFDIDAGCNLDQQSDITQTVNNWSEGAASSAVYQSRFNEKKIGSDTTER